MDRPNVLFLHSHNTGRYVQPCGHAVPTPNLQRFAEHGTLFRNAFAAAPTCSPSRAAFLTGQHPHESGMTGLAHRGWGLHDVNRHIVHTLKAAGYQTVLCGVEHTAPNGNSQNDVVGYDAVLPARGSQAAEVGPAVAAYIKETKESPFFISAGLRETHVPFPDPDPANYPAEDSRYCQPPRPLPDHPEIRRMVAGFKASARAMDIAWGRILDALDETGLAERTLVCCFSDHGLQFAQNMCNLTDHGLAVYLVIRGPGGFEGGRIEESMVSLMDLFPTVCDLAEISAPSWLRGASLMPLVKGQVTSLHDELFGEVTYHAAYEPQRSVRTDRFKYIRRFDNREELVLPNVDDTASKEVLLRYGWTDQPRDQEMLFDTVFDPDEVRNLIDEPRMAAVAEDLRDRLTRWMEETEDPILNGPVPPPKGAKANDPNGFSADEELTVQG